MTSISLVNPETIRRHPANKSPAKQAHQFAKSKRFIQANTTCPIAFYSNRSALSARKTSFGYGNKLDITKNMIISPPSTLYTHRSIFEGKNRGLSFACSRQKVPDLSYLIPQMQKVPGPGQYQNQKETRIRTAYSIRSRTIDVFDKHRTCRETPGPGAYQSIQLQPASGRFMYSKYGDSKFAKITDTKQRFPKQKQGPGPSSYKEKDCMSPSAKYVLSNHRGRGCRPFDHAIRKHKMDQQQKKNVPGPGSYEKPSQFGVYGDAKYYKTLNTSKD